MTKKLVDVLIKDIKYELDGKNLEEAILILNTLAKEHGKNSTIDINLEYGYENDAYVCVTVHNTRLETDAEYHTRLEIEKAREHRQRLYELNQLTLLTKKYGKDDTAT